MLGKLKIGYSRVLAKVTTISTIGAEFTSIDPYTCGKDTGVD